MKNVETTKQSLLMAVTDQEKMKKWVQLSFGQSGPLLFIIAHTHASLPLLLKVYLINNLLALFAGNYNTNTGFRCTIRSRVRDHILLRLSQRGIDLAKPFSSFSTMLILMPTYEEQFITYAYLNLQYNRHPFFFFFRYLILKCKESQRYVPSPLSICLVLNSIIYLYKLLIEN